MYSLRAKETISFIAPSDRIEAQYPSVYFENNNHHHPTLNVEQSNYSLEEIRRIVHNGILKGTIRVQHAIRYLYLVGVKVSEILDDDWKSFGVSIGDKGDNVNVFSMLNVVEDKSAKLDGEETPNVDEKHDGWMVLYLLFIYRFSRATNATYQSLLVDKLRVQAASAFTGELQLPTPKTTFKSWLNNKNYLKIVAAYDMFFCKFPNNDFAYWRFGTITSRFRDCASLLSLNHLRETAGISGNDLFGWMFMSVLDEESRKMMKEGEELDQSDSYAPYMMDFGLTLKSPYSASACPAVYTWCHFICSWLVSSRSRNARFISDAGVAQLRTNAAIVAYVHSKNYDFELQYTDDPDIISGKVNPNADIDDMIDQSSSNNHGGDYQDDDNQSVASTGTVIEYDELPTSRKPLEWLKFIRARKNQLPPKIERFAIEESQKMVNMRAGSIGKHLYDAYA
ncbi:nucleoprotein [Manitoba virus]|uniref:Nucleoprotein n=1 Tax=Manitoba virus TaxID=1272949 RepID=A0A0D3R1X2_9RHAB|nr:nucleoprotein [Manitoba virus]AJR28465.1 nucleoprotein [Manitoba virus]